MSKQNELEIKNKGMLLMPTLEVSGNTVPDGYKVTKCNTDHIMCMVWNPIGTWEPTPNQVLRDVIVSCTKVMGLRCISNLRKMILGTRLISGFYLSIRMR